MKDQPTANTLPTWENNNGGSSSDEDYDNSLSLLVGFTTTVPKIDLLEDQTHFTPHIYCFLLFISWFVDVTFGREI
jgi:hypothetical protein